MVRGRPVALQQVSFEDSRDLTTPGPVHHVLCVQVDGRQISFAISGGGGAPRATGDRIEYGGHTLAFTDVAGEYLSDGAPVSLPERGLHIFYDGRFHGTETID